MQKNFLAGATVLLLSSPAFAGDIKLEGPGRIVDGGAMRVGGHYVILKEVTPKPQAERCKLTAPDCIETFDLVITEFLIKRGQNRNHFYCFVNRHKKNWIGSCFNSIHDNVGQWMLMTKQANPR